MNVDCVSSLTNIFRYLQDIEQIKVLPRIMYSGEDLKHKPVEIDSPVYTERYGKTDCIMNKLRVGYYRNFNKIRSLLLKSKQIKEKKVNK